MNMNLLGALVGGAFTVTVFFLTLDNPRLFIKFMGLVIVTFLLVTFMAWYIPNPWILHAYDVEGAGYYLFCLPEETGIPRNLLREKFPDIGDWCNPE